MTTHVYISLSIIDILTYLEVCVFCAPDPSCQTVVAINSIYSVAHINANEVIGDLVSAGVNVIQ